MLTTRTFRTFFFLTLSFFLIVSEEGKAQCGTFLQGDTIMPACGDSVTLTAFSTSLDGRLLEDFNDKHIGPGLFTKANPIFDAACKSTPDNSPYLWFDGNMLTIKTLRTIDILPDSNSSFCFDFRMADQSDSIDPCEGPDLPDEGVYFQYSTDRGSSWTTIQYFNPDTACCGCGGGCGGKAPSPFLDWTNYCFSIPDSISGSRARFRWYQREQSGAKYDQWGLDDITINGGSPDTSNVYDWGNGITDREDSSFLPNDTSLYTTKVIDTVDQDTCTAEAYVGYRSLEAEIDPYEALKCNNDSLQLRADEYYEEDGYTCSYFLKTGNNPFNSTWNTTELVTYLDGDSVSTHRYKASKPSNIDTISFSGWETFELEYRVRYGSDDDNWFVLIDTDFDTLLFNDWSSSPPSNSIIYKERISCRGPNSYVYDWSPSSSLSDTSGRTVRTGTDTPITYTLTVQDSLHGFCKSSDTIQVDTVNSSPSPNIVHNGSYCEGESDTLTLSKSYEKTVWNDSILGDTLIVDSSFGKPMQKNWVTVTDSNGCKGSDTARITLKKSPDPKILSDSSLCLTGTDTLKLSKTYSSVIWNDNTSQDSLIVDKSFGNPSQTHWVEVTNNNGCTGSDTLQLSLYDLSFDSSITTKNDTLIANNAGASSYQWLSCDSGYSPISGADSRKFYPSTDGDYAAIVKDSGCKDTSECETSLPNSPWSSMGSGVPGTLYSIHFVDSLNGWFVTATGRILYTSDAGITWKLQLDTSVAFHSVDFGTDSSGAVVGTNGTILTTENGGKDWDTENSGVSKDLRSVHFVDATHGWTVGDSGTALHSSDGGTTWTSQPDGNSVDLNGVFFWDRKTGWIVGNYAQMVRTYDGGSNWSYLTNGTSDDLSDVQFVNDTLGWSVGSKGTIIVTENAGDSWTNQNSGTNEDLEAVHFVNDSTGWVVGANGTILYTEDGRSGWSAQADKEPDGFKDVHFISEGNGWAVGEGGTLLNFGRRTPDDPTSIEQEQKEALVNVYPNPVDERLRIDHPGVEGELSFTLFNKLGQRLKTERSTKAYQGRSSLQVNGLEAGIYFLKVEKEREGQVIQQSVHKIVVE